MIITQSEKGKSIGVENMRKLKAQMGNIFLLPLNIVPKLMLDIIRKSKKVP